VRIDNQGEKNKVGGYGLALSQQKGEEKRCSGRRPSREEVLSTPPGCFWGGDTARQKKWEDNQVWWRTLKRKSRLKNCEKDMLNSGEKTRKKPAKKEKGQTSCIERKGTLTSVTGINLVY